MLATLSASEDEEHCSRQEDPQHFHAKMAMAETHTSPTYKHTYLLTHLGRADDEAGCGSDGWARMKTEAMFTTDE